MENLIVMFVKKHGSLCFFLLLVLLMQFFCVTNAISGIWHYADGGSEVNIDSIKNEYNQCRFHNNEQPPSRGEYETKNEYEIRLSRYKKERDCSRFLIKRKIYAQVPVELKYNADSEQFTLSGNSLFIPREASVYDFSTKNFSNEKAFRGIGNSLFTSLLKQPDECYSFQNQFKQNINLSIKSLNRKYFKNNAKLDLFLSASYHRDLYDSWCKFTLSGISLEPKVSVSSDIQQARALKVIENNLVFRIYFEYNLEEYAYDNYIFQNISVYDYESGQELISSK